MLFKHKTALFVQVENTYNGGAPAAWAGTQAILMKRGFQPPRIIRDELPRDLQQGDFSASDFLPGAQYVEFSCDVEMCGKAAAADVPAWDALVRGAGFARTVVTGECVLYTPATDNLASLACLFQTDGLRHVVRGTRNDLTLRLGYNSIPSMSAMLRGFGRVSTPEARLAPSYAAWRRPFSIIDDNSGDIRFGSTFNSAFGSISGGTAYPSKGVAELRIGNDVVHDPLLGGQQVYIGDRQIMATIEMRMTAAQFQTLESDISSDAETTFSFNVGNVAGRRLTVFGPRVSRSNVRLVEHQREFLVSMDLTFMSTASLNDALTIASR